MRKLVFILAFLVLALPIRAKDIYISQSAVGAGNGADCSDAYAYTFFNNEANWPSRIGPGTTVHLCGTISAAAGASALLSFQGSGTSGNPITLVFEAGAVIQAPYWGTLGAIQAYNVSYVVIDGGSNGVVKATANGTNLQYQQNGSGVWLDNCSNCEVKNLSIANIYVHANDPTDENGTGSYAIYAVGGNNLTIDGNTLHDAKWCSYYGYPGDITSTNINVYSNTIFNCDHGVVIGDGNLGGKQAGTNSIHDNTIHDFSNWDDNENNNHHDGIHVWAGHTGTAITGLSIYNNYMYGEPGTHMNAYIYIAGGVGNITGTYVFNNVLTDPNAAIYPNAGFIADVGTNTSILNNTMLGASNSPTGGVCINLYLLGTFIRNNICSTTYSGIYVHPGAVLASSNYDNFFNMSTDIAYLDGTWYSLVLWQALEDANSNIGNPELSASFQLGSGSSAIGKGTNLSTLGIAALNVDKAGNQRPGGTTAWDMGAYQSGGNGSIPNPPTGLTATVN